jgi:hypothetical protein
MKTKFIPLAALVFFLAVTGAALALSAGSGDGSTRECFWYKGRELTFLFPGTPSQTAFFFGGTVNGGHSVFLDRQYDTPETPDSYVVIPGIQHLTGSLGFPSHDHLTDVIQGDPGYTGFYDLKFFFAVPGSGYVPGSVHSVAEAFAAVAAGKLIGPLTLGQAGLSPEFVVHVPVIGGPCR